MHLDQLIFWVYIYFMLTWSEVKRRVNIAKHGFDFVGADEIFAGYTITREDRDSRSELRLQTLGLWNGVVVFVVHAPRDDADRIISIRKAERHEARIYWENVPH
jgi:uncharacterized DUF497 family protein